MQSENVGRLAAGARISVLRWWPPDHAGREVPLTLVRRDVRRSTTGYLQVQTYLAPHPKEPMLRNHVRRPTPLPRGPCRSTRA